MQKRVIRTDEAPSAIGPYSQGIEAGSWVFTAGQIGLDPETGELADTIEAQTARALENIRAILLAAGCGMEQVVKTTVFLRDMGDFAGFNAVYAEMVGDPPPARSTVRWRASPRPRSWRSRRWPGGRVDERRRRPRSDKRRPKRRYSFP